MMTVPTVSTVLYFLLSAEGGAVLGLLVFHVIVQFVRRFRPSFLRSLGGARPPHSASTAEALGARPDREIRSGPGSAASDPHQDALQPPTTIGEPS